MARREGTGANPGRRRNMSDVLTSVRVNDESLEKLRLIAAANGTSVAAEIREAIAARVDELTSSPDFAEKLRAQIAENNAAIERLLEATSL
jgi:predicted DNA-binding protein